MSTVVMPSVDIQSSTRVFSLLLLGEEPILCFDHLHFEFLTFSRRLILVGVLCGRWFVVILVVQLQYGSTQAQGFLHIGLALAMARIWELDQLALSNLTTGLKYIFHVCRVGIEGQSCNKDFLLGIMNTSHPFGYLMRCPNGTIINPVLALVLVLTCLTDIVCWNRFGSTGLLVYGLRWWGGLASLTGTSTCHCLLNRQCTLSLGIILDVLLH